MTLNTNNDKATLDWNRVVANLAVRSQVSTDVITILDSFWVGDEDSWVTGYLLQIKWDPALYEAIINGDWEIKIQ